MLNVSTNTPRLVVVPVRLDSPKGSANRGKNPEVRTRTRSVILQLGSAFTVIMFIHSLEKGQAHKTSGVLPKKTVIRIPMSP